MSKEIVLCEWCGEETPLSLGHQVDGDGRAYCSEKCMCKPGEAGDWNAEDDE